MKRAMRVLPFFAVVAAALPGFAQYDRAELEAEFARKMSGVRMVGTYTDDARPPGSAPEEDGYTIEKVTKLENGRWRFDAQISFRTVEITIPFTLDVEWAGDTPVICVTDMGVPGLGTYTARILIYGDEYAGTWRGSKHGGHMFGRIERDEARPSAGVNWPSFRGPQASGIAEGFPTVAEWNLERGENVRWKQPIAGLSHSAPVIWGNRIYLVTSVGEKEAPLKVGLYGSVNPEEDEGAQKFQVLCLDKTSGETLWTRTAFEGVPRFKRHPKGSFAASTPATDGSHVVAQFGTEGLFCYDTEGKQLWKKDLGELDARWYMMPDTDWGFASSPVLHGKSVIVQCDVMGGSFLAALDVDTGEEIWRTQRDELPGWGTPTVDVRASRSQVIVNGYKHIGGYDLETGAELWKLVGGGDIPVPTPVVARDLVFITSAHGKLAPIYAVPIDASGEVTLDSGLAWGTKKRGNYMQTPLVVGDWLYMCHDSGALRCYAAETGEEQYAERLGDGKTGFTASGVAADGKLYFTSEVGGIHVVKAAPTFELLAVNEMGEECMATPAISEGVLYWRTRGHLVAIGE
jgi:outer membrane protein assembly factor BamB